jgi:hypothetical protein
MNIEEANALLKDRGVFVIHMPDGYMVTISRREGSPSRRIEMDEVLHAVSKWMKWKQFKH